MSRRFLLKEIATQAGLSLATVERVLNRRAGVRAGTVARVEGAITELETQSAHLAMSGRTFVLDLIMEAPQHFIMELRDAVASELPRLHAPAFRIRIDARVHFPPEQIRACLAGIRRRGSDGVVFMGPSLPIIAQAIDGIADARIPLVTLASDIQPSRRHAYVGLENVGAGATAAWFMRRWIADEAPLIFVTMRNGSFASEVQRETGFRARMQALFADPSVHLLIESAGRFDIAEMVAEAVRAVGTPTALYSIGGSNAAIVSAVEAQTGRRPTLVIGHDANAENIRLLVEGKVDVVIHHDLREDIRTACAIFASYHSRGSLGAPDDPSRLRILVPPMLA